MLTKRSKFGSDLRGHRIVDFDHYNASHVALRRSCRLLSQVARPRRPLTFYVCVDLTTSSQARGD
jgi:hypothetical protein